MRHRTIQKTGYRSLLASAIWMALWPQAAIASGINGTAIAELLPTSPLITAQADLNFGTFAPGMAAGSVTMPSLNPAVHHRTSSGGVVLLTTDPGHRAKFLVEGVSSADFSVVLPSNASLTRLGGSETMTVEAFTNTPIDPTLGPSANPSLITGWATLYVGARLLVNPTQVPGIYTGMFPVTVNY